MSGSVRSLKERLSDVTCNGGFAEVRSVRRRLSARQLLESEILVEGKPCTSRRLAICLQSSLDFIQALFALDGVANGFLLISPGTQKAHVQSLMEETGCDALITDQGELAGIGCNWTLEPRATPRTVLQPTTWLMTTSGTTGRPKVVPHTCDSIAATVKDGKLHGTAIWGLLYAPSSFAGVQVILHSLLGGGSLLAVERSKSFPEQVGDLQAGACTHLSATTAMWRKLLMLPSASRLPLQQATLGGDIADERTLRALSTIFPQARITHVYASTEVGVGFSVNDGKPGFPVEYLEPRADFPRLKLQDGMLWVKPVASQFAAQARRDADGFICTGDRVEVAGRRVLFAGRIDTIANVGGVKISVENVEDVVRRQSNVLDCRVMVKNSPMVGSVLALQVVARDAAADPAAMRDELRSWCRHHLPREARPALISVVADLPRNATGKLVRAP